MLAVSSVSPDFADAMRSVASVAQVVPDPELPAWSVDQDAAQDAATLVVNDPLFPQQWGLRAIDAEGAWAAGARGRGARIAILDNGIDHDHPDLAPNINLALSRSFVPGLPVFVPPGNLLQHGTLMAGIMAATNNGVGTVGVAPEAELVAVRVLGAMGFRFSDVIAGITYAADIEADVVNMSFGTNFLRHGIFDAAGNRVTSARDIEILLNALNRATAYAHSKGVTLIAAAGNAGIDRDHDADRLVVPADLNHVIAVSATAPIGFVADQNTNLDLPASYVNYGQSRIDLSAPGGDFQYPVTSNCTLGPITFFCFIFDGVISTANGGDYRWCGGTSCGAAHTSALAALLIGANGGSMDPDEVERIITNSADDLGKPGRDDYHGHGRINAARAVQMLLSH
jgi:subtilisin family serine protease